MFRSAGSFAMLLAMRPGLEPAPASIIAAAKKQNNQDNDQQCGRIHFATPLKLENQRGRRLQTGAPLLIHVGAPHTQYKGAARHALNNKRLNVSKVPRASASVRSILDGDEMSNSSVDVGITPNGQNVIITIKLGDSERR